MIANQSELQRITVYDGHGDAVVERVHVPSPTSVPQGSISSDPDVTRIGHIMSNELVCASAELELTPLLDLIARRHIGCIPVVDRRGHAIGIVTKTDLVETLAILLHADHDRAAPPKRARDVMMPLAITVPESATVAQVATLMVLEDIHHILVVCRENFLVGVVSTKDIVRWVTTSRSPAS
jgi:CBS domain-containing protein